MKKRVVVTCGPIPAKLDSVKFITNRFKGGLAFGTVSYLMAKSDFDITVVTWKMTEIPKKIQAALDVQTEGLHLQKVEDVYEYYEWVKENANNYDAFVMAAAVANLAPVEPYKGKFPSHKYQPYDTFSIDFRIAPRAIDIVKKVNPRACLIGYKLFDARTDDELVDIAQHTLNDSKANVIFANTPKDAKTRKLAMTQDGAVIPMNYEEHNEFIVKAIRQEYFQTEIEPLTDAEEANVDFQYAKAIVKMFEKTFPGYGTVAVPVPGANGVFATTARGHKSSPVFVRRVDTHTKTVYATGKATLNAPALAEMLQYGDNDKIVIHRHEEEPDWLKTGDLIHVNKYLFPGTKEEQETIKGLVGQLKIIADKHERVECVKLRHHGYLAVRPIRDVDWYKYYDQFPKKYFGVNSIFEQMINKFEGTETLEIGGNMEATGKYSYDEFVKAPNSINIEWCEITLRTFQFGYAKNAINYLSKGALKQILSSCEKFMANTFYIPPKEKVTPTEAAVYNEDNGRIYHALRLEDDSIVSHSFFAHTKADYESMGLRVIPYGKNSAFVVKNMEIPELEDQNE